MADRYLQEGAGGSFYQQQGTGVTDLYELEGGVAPPAAPQRIVFASNLSGIGSGGIFFQDRLGG